MPGLAGSLSRRPLGGSVLAKLPLRSKLILVVSIPLFDSTCDTKPPNPHDVCSTGPGHGSNQYYHFSNWIDVTIKEVYINGNDPACMASNGSTRCLIVTFHSMMGPGVLGAPDGDENELAKVGVELIK